MSIKFLGGKRLKIMQSFIPATINPALQIEKTRSYQASVQICHLLKMILGIKCFCVTQAIPSMSAVQVHVIMSFYMLQIPMDLTVTRVTCRKYLNCNGFKR